MSKQTLSSIADKVKQIIELVENSSDGDIVKIIDSVLFLTDYDKLKERENDEKIT